MDLVLQSNKFRGARDVWTLSGERKKRITSEFRHAVVLARSLAADPPSPILASVSVAVPVQIGDLNLRCESGGVRFESLS